MVEKLTKEELKKIAFIARINITDEEADDFTFQMNSMIDYSEIMQTIDTSGVEHMVNPLHHSIIEREDIVKPSLTQQEVLAASASYEHGHFKVPKTIDGQ